LVSEATSPNVTDTRLVRGYTDRHGVGARISRSFSERRGILAIRGRWERNTVPDVMITPSNIDFKKYELGAALRWKLSPRLAVSSQVSHFFIPARTIDESLYQSTSEPTLDAFSKPSPLGRYTARAEYFAVWMSMIWP